MRQTFWHEFVSKIAPASKRVWEWFPDREIMLRTDGRVWFNRVSGRLQMAVVGIMFVLGGWAAYASFSFFLHDQIVDAKNSEILNQRLVYRSLLAEVSAYQQKFSSLTQELEENYGLMLNLVEKNATLQQNLRSTKTQLDTTRGQGKEVAQARAALRGRLNQIESEIHALNSRNFELKGNLNSVSTNLEDAVGERDDARAQSKRLADTVITLRQQLVGLHSSEKDILERLTQRTVENIGELKAVVKRTGLDAEKFLAANAKTSTAQGGPFIAAPEGSEPAERLKANLATLDTHLARLDELRQLMGKLPLAAPLDSFSVTSHYGRRRDPFNGRWAAHHGLDMSSVRRARIYATAPGVVSFAGWKGRYGRVIVIDHGQGIKTRYGHLHKILVKKGQKVDYRARIGLLGSSGRSTGPHLHYEVLYKGRTQNPWRFIKAGKYVYKG